MEYLLETLATLSTCLFAGAAIYINVAEHPARMSCETRVAAQQWAPSYRKATLMQGSLAMVGLIAGGVAWLLDGGIAWLVGALCIGAVVPFTFIVIMPTNHRLLEAGRDLASDETRALLVTWGRLHAVRSALSLLASLIFVGSLASPRLGAQFPVTRVAALVTNHRETEFGCGSSLDDRVREARERIDASLPSYCRAEIGELVEEDCNSLELSQETPGDAGTCFTLVEPKNVVEVALYARMNRQLQSSSALRRASASASGTLCT